MVVVFSDSQGVVGVDCVPVGENVNAEYYLKIQENVYREKNYFKKNNPDYDTDM